MACSINCTVSPIYTSKGRELGYALETSFPKTNEKWAVVRTEDQLRAFHSAAKLQTAFPLKKFGAGLEYLPLAGGALVFLSLGGATGEAQSAALLISAVVSCVILLGVIAFASFKLPVSWAAKSRAQPVEQYLLAAVSELGPDSDLIKSVLHPDVRPDWPSQYGPIDLAEHDLPHDKCSTEWWYYNSHFDAKNAQTGEVRSFSMFAAFFRLLKHVDENGNASFAHALVWAIVDANKGEYYSDTLLDESSPAMLLKSMEKKSSKRNFFERALLDVLKKGNVPLPDRLMTKSSSKPVANSLSLNYDGSTLRSNAKGEYEVKCSTPTGFSVNMTFKTMMDPLRYGGNRGIVKGHNTDEDMFYYFVPRCSVRGKFSLPVTRKSKSESHWQIQPGGSAWYDHEFGGVVKPTSPETIQPAQSAVHPNYAWNWAAIQLSNGQGELSVAGLFNSANNDLMEITANVIQNGKHETFSGAEDIKFYPVPGCEWQSVRSFKSFPTKYVFELPKRGVNLVLEAKVLDQEIMTLMSKPSFWEGRVEISGFVQGQAVSGLGFVERNGFDPDMNLSKFFKSVGEAVVKSVQAMYPLRPTHEELVNLIATKETEYYCDGVPSDILGDTLIAPVRLIADRGGKSWRSYAALACVDAVGGDSRQFVQWVAMPEFLHVGSLIVDDIQDRSETRRGGPCAHLVYGEPLSINAGTAAYFQCEQLLSAPGLSDEEQVRCYKLYFAALRGGHAGQALDIAGCADVIDATVQSGDNSTLVSRICAIHRLKTAVPAGTLARLGCVVGGGSDEQVDAVGKFMEAVGLAFQIMDDVLNLRGIYSGKSDKKDKQLLKTLGEDIRDGKITMPVALYMQLQPDAEARKQMWERIRVKPQDVDEVQSIIDELERVGAVGACVDMSNTIVSEAWAKVDCAIPDSFSKLMLRSFGWFVCEAAGG